MNVSKTALAVSTVLMLSACGGDSTSGKMDPKSPEEPSPVEEKSLSVTVIDGYLEGATVWLDKKEGQNFLPDADEPRAVSNKHGVVVFDNLGDLVFADYVIVAKATAGKTVDHDNGKAVAGTYYLTAPIYEAGVASSSTSASKLHTSVVTPLTTLVEMKLRQPSSLASEEPIVAAINQVAAQLGIAAETADIVMSDYEKETSAEAKKAEQGAVSLVAAGAMPASIDELAKQSGEVLAFADTVNSNVKQAAENEIVIADGAGGIRTIKTTDSDQDGVIDELDTYPEDPDEWYDSDDDGIGNNSDDDDDNDGVLDDDDAFPLNPNAAQDLDNDGFDDEPDDDNDGVADDSDVFPQDPTEDTDTDNDGIGNNQDSDDDNDGVADDSDAFPQDPEEDTDTDNDGIGNNQDSDDDNDGVADDSDAFPVDPGESADTDNDGIGNNRDSDDDNDGSEDSVDDFPLDPAESTDTDGDGIGNNTDDDDDGDGYPDIADNDPLAPLDVPATLNACIDSLPDYAEGEFVSEAGNGRVYHVSLLHQGSDVPVAYTRSELEVGQRDGLPGGFAPGTTVNVTQIVTDYQDQEVSYWDPGFDLMYTDADSEQYLGTEDVFRRWWSVITESGAPEDLKLDEITPLWIERLDHFSPDTPVRHENLSTVYLGKEIIDTVLGHREVCVVKSSSIMDLVDRTAVPDELKKNSIYLEEESKEFFDKDRVLVRSEKSYLEYHPDDKTTPVWGYTDYVQELTGMVRNNLRYGLDPVTGHIPEEQPATMKQCLAALPDAGYEAQVGDLLRYDVYRNDADTNEQQFANYDLTVLVNPDTSWRGHDGVKESSLVGEFYDSVNWELYYSFNERYFTDGDGRLVGIEATENGGHEIAWGSEFTAYSQLSLPGGYRMPEVYHHDGELLNKTSERTSFKQIESVVFAGAEMITDYATEEILPACKRYSRWETHYYQADGSLLLDENNQPVTEYFEQTEWHDNRGLIRRHGQTERWEYESWERYEEVLGGVRQ